MIENYVYKIEVLTPIVIGSGRERILTRLDYISEGNTIYVVDVNRLISSLSFNEAKDFSDRLIKFGNLKDAIKNTDFKRFLKYKIKCADRVDNRKIGVTLTKDVNNYVYIPGSSIKGAIRTAIYYKVFNEAKENLKKELQKLMNEIIKKPHNNIKDNIKEYNRKGDKLLLKIFTSKETDQPHFDPLRFLRITVTNSLPVYENAEIFRIALFKICQKPLTFVEGFIPNRLFFGKIYFDRFLWNNSYEIWRKEFKRLDLLNISALSKILNEFAERIIEHELKFAINHKLSTIETFYQNLKDELKKLSADESIIRIGWGSGYFSTTLGLLFIEMNILKDIRKAFRLGKSSFEFPATRKFAFYKNKLYPLGWAKIAFSKQNNLNIFNL